MHAMYVNLPPNYTLFVCFRLILHPILAKSVWVNRNCIHQNTFKCRITEYSTIYWKPYTMHAAKFEHLVYWWKMIRSLSRHPTGSMFWWETWHSAISQMANNLNSAHCQNFRNHEHLCTWNLQWLKSIHFTTLGPLAVLTSVCIFYPVSRIHATSHTCIYKPVETGFIVH